MVSLVALTWLLYSLAICSSKGARTAKTVVWAAGRRASQA